MNKVTFFSESQIKGRVPRDFENARTEYAWSIMLDAEWCPIGEIPKNKCELGIVIIPKNDPNVDITRLREFCDKIAVIDRKSVV